MSASLHNLANILVVIPTYGAFTSSVSMVSHVLFVGQDRETPDWHFPKESRAAELHWLVEIFEVQAEALLISHGSLYSSDPILQVGDTMRCDNYCGEDEPLRSCVLQRLIAVLVTVDVIGWPEE